MIDFPHKNTMILCNYDFGAKIPRVFAILITSRKKYHDLFPPNWSSPYKLQEQQTHKSHQKSTPSPLQKGRMPEWQGRSPRRRFMKIKTPASPLEISCEKKNVGKTYTLKKRWTAGWRLWHLKNPPEIKLKSGKIIEKPSTFIWLWVDCLAVHDFQRVWTDRVVIPDINQPWPTACSSLELSEDIHVVRNVQKNPRLLRQK